MDVEVTLPDLGENVRHATFVGWLVAAGARVRAGDPIAEVMTDKANVEIPAPVAGTIAELVAAVDDVVEPGALLGRIRRT